ncbi:MAG TPA: class I SAM-dependent methyltransferase, partial [Polyangiaceae bacterium]|nr:class I SAM-dependent methyltransferase [Polyangiaceae bacterium]
PGEQVLDLASGSGEPALTLAKAVGARGHVIATDLSHAMLAIVGECVRARGLTNLSCRQADAGALTFPNESFDLVTSRLGVMQAFPSGEALREAWRVLKVGGRIALLVWDPAAWQAMRSIVTNGTNFPAPKPDHGFGFIA